MMSQRPVGWEAPLAQGLADPVLMAGMPRDYAIAAATLAMLLGLALRIWWLGLSWWFLAHALGVYAARVDVRFFEVARRHLRLPAHLDA
jgi:type IV secretory pathway TrbD component